MAKSFYKHIVVVHGIGEEKLNETSVNFMNELCRALPSDGNYSLTVENLVSRDTDVLVKGASKPAYVVLKIPGGDRYFIGFSEVYWQPETKGYLKAHNEQPPIPIFTWAHSINNRIRGSHRNGQKLSLWRETIDNAEALLGLIARLAVLFKKAKLFNRILRNFLGDVQMYAEVPNVHDAVNRVFRDALDDIADVRRKIDVAFDSNEIYIVAHSEGTVVSWTSLRLAANAMPPPDWLREVKGFVTLGSPIDKHHLIWSEPYFSPPDIPTSQEQKIPWWNFWDYSDPVAYSLDGIFDSPDAHQNNQFHRMFDAGFARYPIPGVAHLGYWSDVDIHHKIIQDVMQIPVKYAPGEVPVESRWWGNWGLMRAVDEAAYGSGRALEIVVLVYFLNRLLAPLRDVWLQFLQQEKWPAVEAWFRALFSVAKTWPLQFGSDPIWQYLNVAIWALGPAAVWKAVWDVGLENYQDEKLNLARQQRREWWAMLIWIALLVLAALSINGPPSPELKDQIGWAFGVLVTALIWKLHTSVHKGLLQLWRYGQGATKFRA